MHLYHYELLKIVRAIEKLTPLLKSSITCPDLTDDNLILKDGELVLIDSENLNVDFGYEYDIFNTKKILFRGCQKLENYYLSLYSKYHSIGTLESHFGYWELVYILRSAGSRFQEQDYREGKRFVNILKKKLKNHISLNLSI